MRKIRGRKSMAKKRNQSNSEQIISRKQSKIDNYMLSQLLVKQTRAYI